MRVFSDPAESSSLLRSNNYIFAPMCCRSSYAMHECVRFIANNWRGLSLCLMVVLTLTGEIILRKAVTTNLYNYRWFLLVAVNGLTVVVYSILLVIRKFQEQRRRKRAQSINVLSSIVTQDTQSGHTYHSYNSLNMADANHTSNWNEYSHTLQDSITKSDHSRNSEKESHTTDHVCPCVPMLLKWKTTWSIKMQEIKWRTYITIAVLDTAHMLLVFIPIGVLPGTVGSLVPLVSICYSMVINMCLACESDNNSSTSIAIRMPVQWSNFVGCILIATAAYLLICVENKDNLYDNSYSSQYVANIIVMIVGSLPLALSDTVKRNLLSKNRIDSLNFNFALSLLTMILLWLCSPIAFRIQYLNQPDAYDAHVHSYSSTGSNFANGWKCMMNDHNSYVNKPVFDICDSAVNGMGHLIILFLLYSFCMACNRFFIHKLVEESMNSATIQHLISGAHIVSFLLFYSHAVQQLFEQDKSGFYDVHPHFKWTSALCFIGMTVGLYLCFQNVNERIQHRSQISDDKWIAGEED